MNKEQPLKTHIRNTTPEGEIIFVETYPRNKDGQQRIVTRFSYDLAMRIAVGDEEAKENIYDAISDLIDKVERDER